jgi:hypothetical protein
MRHQRRTHRGHAVRRLARRPAPPAPRRAITLALTALVALALNRALATYADGVHWPWATPDDWITTAALSFIGAGIILHVGIGLRWPFALKIKEEPMSPEEPTNPAVRRLVAAINSGDRDAFLAALTPDATLTDDGNPRSLTDWIDREIFSAHGHLTIEREDGHGFHLLARYRNDTWGEMSTYWRFQVAGDKISRIDTGQA